MLHDTCDTVVDVVTTDLSGIEEMFSFSRKTIHDASETVLVDYNLSGHCRGEYLASFEDEWSHKITIEKIIIVNIAMMRSQVLPYGTNK